MPDATAGVTGLVAPLVLVARGSHQTCTGLPKQPALGPVDLVAAVTPSDRLTLTSAPEVEIPREHVARFTVVVAVAFVAPSAVAACAVPRFTTVAVIASRIVSVPHWQSPSPFAAGATVRRHSVDCAQLNHGRQWIIRCCRLLSIRDRSCRRLGRP